MNTEESHLDALISLLDDPDNMIFDQVRVQLEKMGISVIPALEKAHASHSFGPLFDERVEDLINHIQNASKVNKLANWAQTDDQDLLEGLFVIAQNQYPEIKKDEIIAFFDQLEKDVWLELNNELTALEKLKVINHILFEVHFLEANKEDYNNPDNSFINRLVQTNKGGPIMLSCVYMILAKRLNLPIVGINLPRHFILAWGDIFSLLEEGKEFQDIDLLFYFNPFSQGAVFGRQDISDFLKEIKIDENPIFYRPCTNIDIIYRTLNNLSHSYLRLGMETKVQEIEAMKQALKK
ncbi:MAG: transglutaminase-like domain-containing protein [Salibacteraceae bacterium]